MKISPCSLGKKEITMASLLWTIITVLFVLWLIGFVANFGGALIHLLLVVALGLLIYNLLTKGRVAV
jgi:4-hydroxybenzoate polyprenyltransferase